MIAAAGYRCRRRLAIWPIWPTASASSPRHWQSNIDTVGFRSLKEGEEVEFDLVGLRYRRATADVAGAAAAAATPLLGCRCCLAPAALLWV